VFEIEPIHPAVLLTELDRARRPVLFDSAAGEPSRWSVLAFDPLPGELDAARGIAAARALLATLRRDGGDDVPGPFAGGFAGAFSYDLGVAGERALDVAPEPWGFPLAVGGLYVDFVVRDERARRSWLVLGEEPGDARPAVAERFRAAEAWIARARAPRALPVRARSSVELARCTPAGEHVRRVEAARAAIARGDYYQVNLAHRFTSRFDGDPRDLYASLRRVNPAPYMGFAAWSDAAGPRAILSASPELLLELGRGVARTRPIKGTAARSSDPREDRASRERLLASEKDRAELAMIVDLERNDLGRVALPGRVWVEGFPTLRSYARVHHLTADVAAEVQPDVGAFELLASLFPGGSVTGAPKLAAMRAIAELEGEGRGYFCGSLGFAGLDGRAAFNVLIRTVCWRPGEVSFRVGGGITWSSVAADEDRETLAKAAGIVDALEAVV
jgi:anthranilate/para-aminobenzoate synthase component I